MIKSILVALDESKSSECARTFSFELAKSYKANLTGIGILDEPWIAAPEAIPLGGAAFKVQLDEQFLKEAKQRIRKLEKAFVEHAKKEKLSANIIDATGVPAYEIEAFITEHDLLMIGKDANFHFTATAETGVSITQLLHDNPRPVILTGDTVPYENSKNILVTYDGTFASSRALHMAILLGLFKGKKVHITNVNTEEEKATNLVNSAATLLKNHGIDCKTHPIASSESPGKAILELSDDLKPLMIVMGAFGHGGIAALFRGSCTKELLKESKVPLFVHH